jgi:hypothetical protein
MTQDQNTRVTENSIIHVERSEKSDNTRDWASLSIWVAEFSVTLVLWSCVTLGFSSSAQDHNNMVTENSITHIDREAQSLVLTDFSDRSM